MCIDETSTTSFIIIVSSISPNSNSNTKVTRKHDPRVGVRGQSYVHVDGFVATTHWRCSHKNVHNRSYDALEVFAQECAQS